MKDKLEELRAEITRVIQEQGRKEPAGPTEYPPELVGRVAAYVRAQLAQGQSMAQCAQERSATEWILTSGPRSAKGIKPPGVHSVDGTPSAPVGLSSSDRGLPSRTCLALQACPQTLLDAVRTD